MSARPRKRGRRGGAPQGEAAPQPSVTRADLEPKTVVELRAMGTELGIDTKPLKKKDEIIEAVLEARAKAEGFIDVMGILDILPEGYGFLRTSGYLPGDNDVYVSMSAVRRHELRKGDMVSGQVRPPKETEKYAALQKVGSINGKAPEDNRNRKEFKDLTPIYPDEKFKMEWKP
ncbi:MAG TPA: Rho termination factor N-terminal domain-containing protein, partial [Coriobacteriia bacterium]